MCCRGAATPAPCRRGAAALQAGAESKAVPSAGCVLPDWCAPRGWLGVELCSPFGSSSCPLQSGFYQRLGCQCSTKCCCSPCSQESTALGRFLLGSEVVFTARKWLRTWLLKLTVPGTVTESLCSPAVAQGVGVLSFTFFYCASHFTICQDFSELCYF